MNPSLIGGTSEKIPPLNNDHFFGFQGCLLYTGLTVHIFDHLLTFNEVIFEKMMGPNIFDDGWHSLINI